ncbi:hypothetical protein U9M48_029414 [Paspalum notatum var. saurae]|uniref:Uncharacterized protein n=1 Tax=Paspalum notatum var. saurae TaxID=547442 RepID=A0AAQ3TYV5_PASNO
MPRPRILLVRLIVGYPPSPFELGFSHPALCRLQKTIPYKWMMNSDRSAAELERPWIHITTPSKIVISGVEVRGCLMQTGTFSVSLVDAIMRLWTHLDDRMHSDYEKIGLKYKRWRHFLPTTFSVCVRDGSDFLGSDIIKQSFLGDHLKYDVEDCQMVEAIKSSIRHEEIVIDLHKALFSCKDRFFSGWDVSSTGWSTFYLTDFPPKSKFNNTGLYAVHYARNFTGDLLANELKDASESNLSEIRGEILYLLLSIARNFGYKPQELFTALRQWWRQ